MCRELLTGYIDKMRQSVERLCDDIFDHPEPGCEEFYSSQLLQDELAGNGFSVEPGIGGLATAFRATYENGSGGPSIGLLCEYDAIEGLGHACSHHLQGPAIAAAAIALKNVLRDHPYRMVVYGTPAEETIGGKIIMKDNGCFKDIDVALMMHGSPTTTTDIKTMALLSYVVTFKGISAHPAICPEKGRSALDALILACNGVEFMREHVLEDSKMHYVIRCGGGAANAVPERSVGEFTLRSYNTTYLLGVLVPRFKKVLEGAALMTETEYSLEPGPLFMGKIPVLRLNELLIKNAAAVGAPSISAPREKTGSTDFGNVMFDVPGSCIRVAFVPLGTSSHSGKFLEMGKGREAHDAAIYGAKILALTAADIIESPKLLSEIKEEFHQNKKKFVEESRI